MAGPQRGVACWLLLICAMLLVMIVLGGATRLTGSGLSIMEWAPIDGVLPPLSAAEWQRLFALYQQTPQYHLLHDGFGLAGFKGIFWLEWIHRLWGRLIGLAFLLPLLWFWSTGRIDRLLRWRLAGLFVLGGLQGAVGWFMVQSGFAADSIAVSPYRLAAHLSLALMLYTALLWTALATWRPTAGTTPRLSWLGRMAAGLLACVALTILAGAFVSGLHAGLIYNTFPLMDGRLVPAGYDDLAPFIRNLTENVAAVQFDHRLMASLTAGLALTTVAYGLSLRPQRQVAVALLGVLACVAAQYGLGVATLLNMVPLTLAVCHQTMAVLLLSAVLYLIHTIRPSLPA